MEVLDFGKNKGKVLATCDESYIIWLAQHEMVLAKRNRGASKLAKQLLAKKEEIMSQEKMSYEEYKEQELLCIWTDWEGPTVEDLKKQYPEHAARAKQEADARRGGTLEEYQAQQEDANPPEQETIFILDAPHKTGEIIQDGKYQYRAVKDAEWISAKEAAEIAEFADPSASAGWYVKAELVK